MAARDHHGPTWKRLFVPGRVCLFGEHSDWSGGFRRFNTDIQPGATIVVGTNQGIKADVRRHPHSLIVTSTTHDGVVHGPLVLPMRKQDLLEAAKKGDFFSYAAGVAYKILADFQVNGLEVHNFETDLPDKKGLSSSAAVCVLVARAFNALYDLKMTIRGEMEYAYQGEILTPSQCGRMDQGCAYGPRPIIMRYDGEFMDVEEIQLSSTPLHYVIVDLQGSKSTTEILKGLQAGFPTPGNDVDRGVHELLGPINLDITRRACEALMAGKAAELGALMNEAQAHFDRLAQPACPSQLTMPLLHRVLGHAPLQQHIHGSKGVGSQGDGTAQILCKSAADQDTVVAMIEATFSMPSLKLTLASGPQIKNALIPAAGFGASNFPATKTIKAELFPVITSDGVSKPAILVNVECLVKSGVQNIYIIVQDEDLPSFERLFKSEVNPANFARLSKGGQAYDKKIRRIGEHVHFIVQSKQEGFGHAVYCAKDKLDKEPFLLMLGDHIYRSTNADGVSCVQQMMDTYNRHRCSVIGLKKTQMARVERFGAVTGVFSRDSPGDDGTGSDSFDHRILKVTKVVEKPTVKYARENLVVNGLKADEALTAFGQYIVSPKVFEYLEQSVEHNVRSNGDFQFTPALDRLRKEGELLGLVIEGERYDIGDPESYFQMLEAFRHPELGTPREALGRQNSIS